MSVDGVHVSKWSVLAHGQDNQVDRKETMQCDKQRRGKRDGHNRHNKTGAGQGACYKLARRNLLS